MLGPFTIATSSGPNPATLLATTHHRGWVLLSLLLAWGTIGAALYMAQLNREADAVRHRRVSLLCASLLLGLGLWAMHFIAMMATQWPLAVGYAPGITLLTVLPAMVAAWLALWGLQSRHPSLARVLVAGVGVGIGLAVMHYGGLSALELDGHLRLDMPLFVASLAAAALLACLALGLHRALSVQAQAAHGRWRLAIPALVLTAAVASVHYLSMWGLRIVPMALGEPSHFRVTSLHTAHTLSLLLVAVTAVVGLVLGLANALLRYHDLLHALRSRDARLNAMMDTSADGVITIDAQGHIHEFNPAAERMFGYARDEVRGQNVAVLMPSPLAEQHDAHLLKHAGRPERTIGFQSREVLGKHKDGRHIPLQLSIGKAMTEAGVVFVGFLQDISNRKRTDAQLRIAASVFQHVREGVAIVDANHNISDVNPAFLRLMELAREDCVGQPLETLYERAEVGSDMSKLWATVATEQYWQSVSMFTRRNGAVWMQRLSISPVLNELHRPHHFIAVISDVSERPGLEMLLSHPELRDTATDLPSAKHGQDRLVQGMLLSKHRNAYLALVLVQLQPPKSPASQPNGVDYTLALRFLADFLQHQLRNSDTLVRWDEDQLALILPGIVGEDAFPNLLARLQHSVHSAQAQCMPFGVHQLHMGASCTQYHGSTPAELLEHARQVLAPVQPRTPDALRPSAQNR